MKEKSNKNILFNKRVKTIFLIFFLFSCINITNVFAQQGDYYEEEVAVVYAGLNIVTYTGVDTTFNGSGTTPSGIPLTYSWDFNNDGIIDYTSQRSGSTSHNYFGKKFYLLYKVDRKKLHLKLL